MVDVGDPDWLHSVVGESKKVEDIRQRLAAIIDSSDDAIISKDLDGHILTWNAAAHRLLGFPASEAVGQPITIIVPPDLHEEEQGVLARLRAGERVDHFETRRIARDGRSLDVSLTISPLRDSAGTIIGALKILRDITESRRAQDGLRDTVQRLAREVAAERTLQSISTRLISESTQESLFAKILDAAMELMAADAASVQMLAADGKSLVLLASQYFHPDSAAFWDRVTADAGSTCAHALRTNTRVVVADVEMSDFMAGTTDLHEYRRSQLRAVQSTPLQSRSGRPLGMLSTHWRAPHMPVDDDFRLFDVLARQAADLIERMRTENALRESDARFRDIANTAPVTIWMSDANRLCTYVNQAWLDFTGQSLDSALGTGWMACLHPDDAPRSWAAFTRAIGTREPFHVEVRMCRHDGEYRWVISRGVPRYDSDGSFAGFIGHRRDRKQARRRSARDNQSAADRRAGRRARPHRSRTSRRYQSAVDARERPSRRVRAGRARRIDRRPAEDQPGA
jgi:PAS domain S-box-containing protein